MRYVVINELNKIHGKKIKLFVENWSEETKSVILTIIFDDDTEMTIQPYIDIDSKFEGNRNDLRLKYIN